MWPDRGRSTIGNQHADIVADDDEVGRGSVCQIKVGLGKCGRRAASASNVRASGLRRDSGGPGGRGRTVYGQRTVGGEGRRR